MKFLSLFLIVFILFTQNLTPHSAANQSTKDLTTKYRVYQDVKLIEEFSELKNALELAKKSSLAYVEEISSGSWVWNNYPRYQVYEKGVVMRNGTFQNLDTAITFAKTNSFRSIRDLQSTGWVWNNYPNFRVFVGDQTNSSWLFATLEDAIGEAKKWKSANVIDLSNNKWVWDNYSSLDKKKLCQDNMEYRIYQGTRSYAEWQYPCLREALLAITPYDYMHIVNLSKNKIVYKHRAEYNILKGNRIINKAYTANQAISIAKQVANSEIMYQDQVIWKNSPYYQVFQTNKIIKEFTEITQALSFAKQFRDSVILTSDQQVIWKNESPLHVWSWGPVVKTTNVSQFPAINQVVDIVSPNFFRLEKTDGTFRLNSKKEYITHLLNEGYDVHLHMTNLFEDTQTTSEFLNYPGGQRKFISELVRIASELKVQGINIDLEMVGSKDRNVFSSFVEQFASEAHAKNLQLSVVIPRVNSKNLHAYDYARISKAADYIHYLSYTLPYVANTKPTTQLTFDWIEEGIQELLSYGVPRYKIFLGVPLFVKVWGLSSSGNIQGFEYLESNDIKAFLSDKNYKKTWVPEAKQYKITYQVNNKNYFFWLEDEQTARERILFVNKYKLAGIAIWKIGQDEPEIWDMIRTQK